jgi:hypothetical protein
MTADLGRSWLDSTPDGATVTRRETHLCTVAAVWPGDYFTARMEGRRGHRPFDWALVPDWDVPLVKPGARFWLPVERVVPRGGGRVDVVSALAFRRPGALSPERAFTDRRENADA